MLKSLLSRHSFSAAWSTLAQSGGCLIVFSFIYLFFPVTQGASAKGVGRSSWFSKFFFVTMSVFVTCAMRLCFSEFYVRLLISEESFVGQCFCSWALGIAETALCAWKIDFQKEFWNWQVASAIAKLTDAWEEGARAGSSTQWTACSYCANFFS